MAFHKTELTKKVRGREIVSEQIEGLGQWENVGTVH